MTISAIDGPALVGGPELGACTLHTGGPDAKLCVPEIRIGRGAALDLLVTGRSTGPQDGVRRGLIDRVVADGAASEAGRLAERLASMPASTLSPIERCVDAAQGTTLEEGLDLDGAESMELFDGADAREGLAAFLQKRARELG